MSGWWTLLEVLPVDRDSFVEATLHLEKVADVASCPAGTIRITEVLIQLDRFLEDVLRLLVFALEAKRSAIVAQCASRDQLPFDPRHNGCSDSREVVEVSAPVSLGFEQITENNPELETGARFSALWVTSCYPKTRVF